MSEISPKLIDIDGNRIDTKDKLFRSITKKDYKNYWVFDRSLYNETSRYPTQLFTNIKKDRYKYVRNIT